MTSQAGYKDTRIFTGEWHLKQVTRIQGYLLANDLSSRLQGYKDIYWRMTFQAGYKDTRIFIGEWPLKKVIRIQGYLLANDLSSRLQGYKNIYWRMTSQAGYKDIYWRMTSQAGYKDTRIFTGEWHLKQVTRIQGYLFDTQEFVLVTFHSYSALTNRQTITNSRV